MELSSIKMLIKTNHLVTKANIIGIVADGRSRWKTVHCNHNILKTKGYHLEHNFGHGDKHLASLFATFNLRGFSVSYRLGANG